MYLHFECSFKKSADQDADLKRLTLRILDDSTDVVPCAVGGDGGQSDLVGQRNPQVGYGVGHQHAAVRLLALEVDLLGKQVLLVLDKCGHRSSARCKHFQMHIHCITVHVRQINTPSSQILALE